jgi:hypothetical protein
MRLSHFYDAFRRAGVKRGARDIAPAAASDLAGGSHDAQTCGTAIRPACIGRRRAPLLPPSLRAAAIRDVR